MAVKQQRSSKENVENKEHTKYSGKKDGIFTKVILRRLPPTMTESELLEQISPLPEHDYFLFVPADQSLSPWTFTRAYMNFSKPADVISFRDRFDGYIFVDNKGNEYPAIVEMAPNTKIPKPSQKRDVKIDSLGDDPEYKKFLEQLKNPAPVQTLSLEACLEEIDKKIKERKETKGAPKIPTPLTEFLKEKREEKLRRQQDKRKRDEERRKQRLEWEKEKQRQVREQEKRRQQREQENEEQEVKKHHDRSNIPPRFQAKDEAKKAEKYKDETGASKTQRKSGSWRGDRAQYYDDNRPSKYYDDDVQETKYQPVRRHKNFDQQGTPYPKPPRKVSNEKTQVEKQYEGEREGKTMDRETMKLGEGGDREEKKSKPRYKDRPSVPIYQPGRKKTDTAKSNE